MNNSEFIKSDNMLRAIRKSEIAAAKYHPDYFNKREQIRQPAIMFVLKNGEMMAIYFEDENVALKIMQDL